MADIMEWMEYNPVGEWVYTALMSMVPVIELRGGIPFGVGLGLDIWPAFVAAVVGNMIPVPFIILFIRSVFRWLRRVSPRTDSLVTRLENRAHVKGRLVTKYQYLGLFILVAIPLPGTGAWTGSLVAALLDMRISRALPAIFLGVLAAGVAISAITFGVTALF